jgi:hypothetical protein
MNPIKDIAKKENGMISKDGIRITKRTNKGSKKI